MDDHAVADVDRYMAAVVDDITGAHVGCADRSAGVLLGTGGSGKGDAPLRVDQLGKAGAVRTGLQTVAAVYVLEFTNEALGVTDDGCSGGRGAAGAGLALSPFPITIFVIALQLENA